MSEQEFDLYLKLLAKCLRLTSGQRELIADELRDHLEERLEELARAGVPRERAVAQALDEFGDAAVLAAHFTTIARLKRRRFLMRLSLGSVGALTAALLIGYAFWPENRALRGPEQIVAQENTKAEKPKAAKPKLERSKGEPAPPAKPAASGKSHGTPARPHPAAGVKYLPVDHPLSSDQARQTAVEARITEALDQPIDFNIEPQALKDAIDFIAARYQIPILLEMKSLDDANVDVTTEVKLAAPGIPLRDALQLIFGQLSSPLNYDVTHGVLMIATEEKIKDHLETIVYDCRDLIALPALSGIVTTDRTPTEEPPPTGATSGAGFQVPNAPKGKKGHDEKARDGVTHNPPFLRMVISATGTEFWDEDTSISELGGLLIVRQNPRMHDRIKALLASIRLMRKDGAFAGTEHQTFQPRPSQGLGASYPADK
jgi:hypothetical protein